MNISRCSKIRYLHCECEPLELSSVLHIERSTHTINNPNRIDEPVVYTWNTITMTALWPYCDWLRLHVTWTRCYSQCGSVWLFTSLAPLQSHRDRAHTVSIQVSNDSSLSVFYDIFQHTLFLLPWCFMYKIVAFIIVGRRSVWLPGSGFTFSFFLF